MMIMMWSSAMNQVGFHWLIFVVVGILIDLFLDLPTASMTDNMTGNITEYPINYADLGSPLDGVPELRTSESWTKNFFSYFLFYLFLL